ncbi:MAG: cardiolipin synthase [Clostridia bacterium]|nr:cardiolipin synthase [Clostridia bacterium]
MNTQTQKNPNNIPKSTRPKRRKGNTVRLVIMVLFIILQACFLVFSLFYFNVFALSFYILFQLISAITVIHVISTNQNPSYKIAWISMILAIPILGVVFYNIWGGARNPRRIKRRVPILKKLPIPDHPESQSTFEKLAQEYPFQAQTARFLSNSGFPLYRNTQTEYYDLGDTFFPALLESIKKAEHFIFLEFFIISKGKMWDELYDALCQRAAAGVEVRVLYDDLGSMTTLDKSFPKKHERENLKIAVFNPVKPVLSHFHINYRNHQKICVIDGKVAYTGGVNIADEYINLVDAFGHWKDSGVKLEGPAVQSMTVMFLQMWNYGQYTQKKDQLDKLSPYFPHFEVADTAQTAPGFVQPLCDGPLDPDNRPMEYLYMHMINHARKYIYITTPYLVLDNEMATALCMAAISGVDVRIMTPGIPDKKYVYALTRSYYGRLLQAGVQIFEYTPGFIHAKNVVSDDEAALVGTVNMDFRSFYMHYENAVWTCGTPIIRTLHDDFIQTQSQCREITYETWKNRPVWYKILQGILNIFAPML